jgi:hypothetical protein
MCNLRHHGQGWARRQLLPYFRAPPAARSFYRTWLGRVVSIQQRSNGNDVAINAAGRVAMRKAKRLCFLHRLVFFQVIPRLPSFSFPIGLDNPLTTCACNPFRFCLLSSLVRPVILSFNIFPHVQVDASVKGIKRWIRHLTSPCLLMSPNGTACLLGCCQSGRNHW